MNTRTRLLGLLMIALTSTAFGDTPPAAKPQANASAQAAKKPSAERASCLNYCDTAEGQCSSAVRQARSECSKRAATEGRDPFTMRNKDDYGYFCGYFGNGSACGTGAYSNSCRSRFSHTYGVCMSTLRENVASMRYDCFQTERAAQNYCRDELRECKAACPTE